MAYIRWFEEIGMQDVPDVGGKNASLGEMVQNLKKEGVEIPDGFATTASAYWDFIQNNHLEDKIKDILHQHKDKRLSLEETGKSIRNLFIQAEFSSLFKEQLCQAYRQLCKRNRSASLSVAVRSSATAEDLPDASFAGQQETFLHIQGEDEVLKACKKCFASLFTDRAIAYREAKGFDHLKVALSIGIQRMVSADRGGAGVMFTIDTENGFPHVVVINASWGLGETVVQGTVTPDEYRVFKQLLDKKNTKPIIEKILGDKENKLIYSKGGTKIAASSKKERASFVLEDEEILTLSRWAVLIEKHYQKPMDIEWAKDGKSKRLFIVQARPETVQSRKDIHKLTTYRIKTKGTKLLEGLAIGDAIVSGKVQVIKEVSEIRRFIPGSILVTKMTSPDWVPIMKQAKGIITDHGGRTSHAAIVSRELGLPAIVGTNRATTALKDGQEITLSCAEGEIGFIYEGAVDFEKKRST